jgi:hypothetical protein
MKSMYIDFIGVRTDKGKQPAAHGDSAGIGIGQTEDIAGEGICFQEDLPDPGSKDLGFARPGAGDNHDGAFSRVYGQSLFFVKLPVFFPEMLLEFLPVDGHGPKVRDVPCCGNRRTGVFGPVAISL